MSTEPTDKAAGASETPDMSHISIEDNPPTMRPEGESAGPLTDSKGWDGKLRLPPKEVIVSNPEAFSDPEYSDDENVLEGEEIAADEGASWNRSQHASYTIQLLTTLML